LFSRPDDFTPVCTTELGYTAKIKPDSEKVKRQDRPVGRPGHQALGPAHGQVLRVMDSL
jgi:hypothetical protein